VQLVDKSRWFLRLFMTADDAGSSGWGTVAAATWPVAFAHFSPLNRADCAHLSLSALLFLDKEVLRHESSALVLSASGDINPELDPPSAPIKLEAGFLG
jgi:hypothetical protein